MAEEVTHVDEVVEAVETPAEEAVVEEAVETVEEEATENEEVAE
jgi:hypothetical protein